MRVLCVGALYPPHHFGGYELVWQEAVAHLRSRGHAVRVLATGFRLEPPPAAPEDADVHRELRWYWRDHRWPRRTPWSRARIERHNVRTFDRHVRAFRPDVVAWWAMGGLSLSLIGRAHRGGLPAVGIVHDDWLVYGPYVDAWLRLRRRLPGARVPFAAAAEWLFVSDFTRRRAESAVGPLPRAGVAHSGIDPALVDPRPERPWRWKLLYVGRIDFRKGIRVAVTALEHLPPAATLTVVGSGDPAETAAVSGRDRVRLAGPRRRSELPSFHDEADVVVFPVVWEEPWGLVPLEAMALGRPVVATARGGSAEYLRDGENALVVPAGDPEALAAAVRRLAADPALRARLRAGGERTARAHTHDSFHAALVAALERARARGA